MILAQTFTSFSPFGLHEKRICASASQSIGTHQKTQFITTFHHQNLFHPSFGFFASFETQNKQT